MMLMAVPLLLCGSYRLVHEAGINISQDGVMYGSITWHFFIVYFNNVKRKEVILSGICTYCCGGCNGYFNSHNSKNNQTHNFIKCLKSLGYKLPNDSAFLVRVSRHYLAYCWRLSCKFFEVGTIKHISKSTNIVEDAIFFALILKLPLGDRFVLVRLRGCIDYHQKGLWCAKSISRVGWNICCYYMMILVVPLQIFSCYRSANEVEGTIHQVEVKFGPTRVHFSHIFCNVLMIEVVVLFKICTF